MPENRVQQGPEDHPDLAAPPESEDLQEPLEDEAQLESVDHR